MNKEVMIWWIGFGSGFDIGVIITVVGLFLALIIIDRDFPMELPKRLIRLYYSVYDPFAGY